MAIGHVIGKDQVMAIGHVIGKDQVMAIGHVNGKDQVMAIGHVYVEHDVRSDELKTFDINSNSEISYDKI